MRTRGLVFLLTLLMLAMMTAPSQAYGLGGHDRDGYVINFNIGSGWTWLDFSVPDEDGNLFAYETDKEWDLAGGLSIGWARSDKLIVSVGVYGFKSYYRYNGNPVNASSTQFQIDACYFPRGQGFWLKGGVGPGNISFNAVVPRVNVTFQEWGWALVGGAGYEFRLSDTMAFGLAYEYRDLAVGAFEGFDDTNLSSHNALFSFRWYMD